MNYEVEFIKDIPCIYRMKLLSDIRDQMENNSSSSGSDKEVTHPGLEPLPHLQIFKVSMSSRTVS